MARNRVAAPRVQARRHWAHAAPPPTAWLTVLSAYSSTCYPSPLNPASRRTRSSCRSPSRVTHIPCFPSFPTRHYRDVLLRNHFICGLSLAHRMNHFMTAPLLEQTTHKTHTEAWYTTRFPRNSSGMQYCQECKRACICEVHHTVFPIQHLFYALHTVI